MLKSKLVSTIVLVFIGILIIYPISANAATFNASIDVGGVDVAGFTIWLDVNSEFTFTGGTPILPEPYGAAIPASWEALGLQAVSLGATTDTPRLAKFGASDVPFAFGSPADPLTSDVLFSFDYTGIINGLNLVQFPDYGNPTQDLFQTGDIFLASSNFTGESTSAVFNAVPIPGSILLLGSGLVGLIGIARRKRS